MIKYDVRLGDIDREVNVTFSIIDNKTNISYLKYFEYYGTERQYLSIDGIASNKEIVDAILADYKEESK